MRFNLLPPSTLKSLMFTFAYCSLALSEKNELFHLHASMVCGYRDLALPSLVHMECLNRNMPLAWESLRDICVTGASSSESFCLLGVSLASECITSLFLGLSMHKSLKWFSIKTCVVSSENIQVPKLPVSFCSLVINQLCVCAFPSISQIVVIIASFEQIHFLVFN